MTDHNRLTHSENCCAVSAQSFTNQAVSRMYKLWPKFGFGSIFIFLSLVVTVINDVNLRKRKTIGK